MSEGLSRRSFLKIAAAAGTAAALPGCEPAARKLIPYVVPDENVIPGVASYYASTCNECSAGCGIVAKIREGRVIKLEGNPADPIGQGSICARGQASLQGLYNPDRLSHPQQRAEDGRMRRMPWDKALDLLNEKLSAASKAGKDRVAYIGAPNGPTTDLIVKRWAETYQSGRTVFYEAFSDEVARTAGQACFGRRDLPVYKLDQAQALISFGADFTDTWRSPIELARQYVEFRTPKKRQGELTIGRSAYVGPVMTMTAGKCDEWIAPAPGTEAALALGILNVLVSQGWANNPSPGVDLAALKTYAANFDPESVSRKTGVPASKIKEMAQWFGQADGALAIAGTGDLATHIAAYLLNAATGNIGKTVVFLDNPPAEAASTPDEVSALVQAMHAGQVDVLVVAGSNPLFTMAQSLRFAEALKKVPFIAWLGEVPDETAAMAHLLAPTHHPLATWRDTAPRSGVNGLGQPTMQPVFESRPLGDILLSSAHAGGATAQALPWENTAEAVLAQWQALQKQVAPKQSWDAFWEQVRREGGFFQEAGAAAVSVSPAVLKMPPTISDAPKGLTLAAYAHPFLYDGRGANKPWLQEIPEPVSQVVWGTWVQIHPETAKTLSVATDDLIELRTDYGVIQAPALVSQFARPGVAAVPTGQGHSSFGRYARDRGANVFSVLPAGQMISPVKVTATGRRQKVIRTASGDDMMGRSIVEAMSIDELARGIVPKSDTQEPPPGLPTELYKPFEYPKHMWGMTIDVNSCTGCSACVAACYAENNIQVVGPEGVDRGRVMSWIRIERYVPPKKEADNAPLLYVTPMLCQQCDHAPCEPVCPVFASSHTKEGLNAQIYPRCIGTRYCENNCPYQVRRFNWFAPEFPEPLNLQLNPDVTVRGAGVMEKCTFCIQRIVHAEIQATVDSRPVRDGEIIPACAQACPTHAISFGDMDDPDSKMMKRRRDNQLRNYRALEDLNTRPGIVYLRDIYRAKERA